MIQTQLAGRCVCSMPTAALSCWVLDHFLDRLASVVSITGMMALLRHVLVILIAGYNYSELLSHDDETVSSTKLLPLSMPGLCNITTAFGLDIMIRVLSGFDNIFMVDDDFIFLTDAKMCLVSSAPNCFLFVLIKKPFCLIYLFVFSVGFEMCTIVTYSQMYLFIVCESWSVVYRLPPKSGFFCHPPYTTGWRPVSGRECNTQSCC